mgnify:FL=1
MVENARENPCVRLPERPQPFGQTDGAISRHVRVRRIILLFSLLFIWGVMFMPGGGEWYARTVYPGFSWALSAVSSFFPFPLGDLFVCGALLFFVLDFAKTCTVRRKGKWRRKGIQTAERLLWLYVWFYVAWGLTYYRDDFFVRNQITPRPFSKEEFCRFLDAYADSLNGSYRPFVEELPECIVANEIEKAYQALPASSGLCAPASFMRAKYMLFPSLMSGVGVTGYIDPFFMEYNLNPQLLPVQYPATYAHEMAHVLGVSNEAEANYYGYLVCTSSSMPEIRFSGYFSLLGYVLSNAYSVLGAREFDAWKNRIRPEIRELYNHETTYWHSLYNPYVGTIQNWAYNAYLKGNGISSGITNYAEVISLIIASEP